MRIFGFILLVAAALYGTGIGAMALYQRRLIYPGAFSAMFRGAIERPPGVEPVTVKTADGESLHGLWRPPRPGCGLVLSFHGNASRPEWHADRFTKAPWKQAGWGVLAIAYRGYPGSTGTPSEEGLIQDAVTAYLFAAERAPGAPILLHGHSLGAAVAVALAEQAPHIGLYLEAPFDSMSHLVRLHYPFVPSGSLLRDTYRSDLRIAKGSEPVVIVQGDSDDIVLPKLALSLAAAAGKRAMIAVIPGDHVSIIGSRDAQTEAFFRDRVGNACANAP